MRKSLIVTLLVIVGAAAAWPAAAQDCQYHQITAVWNNAALVDPGDFDICIEFDFKGTINGRYKICWNLADIFTSDSYYGDGYTQIQTSYYYSWIETKKGSLVLREWGWLDTDFNVEDGFSKVISGTGDFAGASGSLAWARRTPAQGFRFKNEGYICTP